MLYNCRVSFLNPTYKIQFIEKQGIHSETSFYLKRKTGQNKSPLTVTDAPR